MKRTVHILFVLLLLLPSCLKDVLDKQPLDTISDAVVWNDQALIDAYLTQAYLQMYILDNETPNSDWASSDDWNGPFIVNELSDECTRNWTFGQSAAKTNGLTIAGGVLDWWEHAYTSIRTLNEFIKRVPASPVNEGFKKSRVAEARFLRAYNYFSMVKRYGGVPIITEPQDINAGYDELYRARDKEQQVYDFILSEADAIIADLPERGAAEYGRPSKGTALALKCRAALYAASIAQFGTVELNGITGIPAS
ncbi:MAG TPA: RagB/SusD family nutrient uptake outer membrane protein, partial [Chitinophaga sp.]